MHLTVLLPSHILVSAEVAKINAEAPTGAFCLLPRHVDFVTALAPGLLSYTDMAGAEHFLAVADGLLVKQGPAVRVATLNAVEGEELGRLQETVRHAYRAVDEREQRTRRALARLEADFVHRFIDLNSDDR